MQQNSKYRLCGDGYETINHMIGECSKLAEKECKTRRNPVGKVIHGELCKKLKFDRTTKSFMHKPESVPENDRNQIIGDFHIQTDHLISARQPGLVIFNQKI